LANLFDRPCKLVLSLGPPPIPAAAVAVVVLYCLSQLLFRSSYSSLHMLFLFSMTSEKSFERPIEMLPWLLRYEFRARLLCFVVMIFSGICWKRLRIESLPRMERLF